MKRILLITGLIAAIVIAAIGVLIAIGISGYNSAIRSTNEAAAIKTLLTIAEQQSLYYNSHQQNTYGTFDEMLKNDLLDTRFAGIMPVVDGYVYTMRVVPKSPTAMASFSVTADPEMSEGIRATGKNHFYYDSATLTIHFNSEKPAAVTDPAIKQ